MTTFDHDLLPVASAVESLIACRYIAELDPAPGAEVFAQLAGTDGAHPAVDAAPEPTTVRIASAVAEVLLRRCAEAVLLVDAQARVTMKNCVADTVLARQDGLVLSGTGHLETVDSATTSALLAAVSKAFPGRSGVAAERSIVAIPRPSTRKPYVVSVAPLPSVGPMQRGPCCATVVVMLRDPDTPLPGLEEPLRSVYGLTVAECRVVEGVLDGHTTVELSDRFGTSANTINTQLKSAYAKLGVRRKSELLRTCLRLMSIMPR